jgi:hypothetical protein
MIEKPIGGFNEHHQQTACEGIERAAVADFWRLFPLPLRHGFNAGLHERKARRADRFVHEVNAGIHRVRFNLPLTT